MVRETFFFRRILTLIVLAFIVLPPLFVKHAKIAQLIASDDNIGLMTA